LKSLKRPKIAVIGGTGFEKLFKETQTLQLETRYGAAPPLSIADVDGRKVVFLPRHGPHHSIPPHKVNYRANIHALHEIEAERIIAVNAVGAISRDYKPGDIVFPHDFVDFTKQRTLTYYDDAPVTHVDFSKPYCPEIRRILTETARTLKLNVKKKAVLVCTEGPRFETPAEVQMFRLLGCEIVGMTGLPEAVLARELGMCYAPLCFVSNMAAGMQEQLTPLEIPKISEQIMPNLEQLLIETVKALPASREGKCPCANALRNARLKG
jgi:5'-methylthioadenosine phosphorylase